MELKEKILIATLNVFQKKGMKFRMDEIAMSLNISKKTIYEVFQNKEALCLEMMEYTFDRIKQSENEILDNTSLETIEKLRAVLSVLPKTYVDIDVRQLYILKDRYPKLYKQLTLRLENEWESTFALIYKGMEEGKIRKMNLSIFKLMFEATVEKFFQKDVLIQNKMTYKQGLDEVVNLLLDGILTHNQ